LKKIGKILAIVIGVLFLIIIAIAIALPFIIDPNNYKTQIIQAVKQQTGRELKIGGKIGWSVFPWIGVEMRRLELSNAPGFGEQPFARIETVGVRVKLLPLLKKDVTVDKVSLTGLNLNLAKNQAGKTNWDDLMTKKPAPAPATPSEPGAPAVSAFSIGGIDIRAGEISWNDQATGASYKLHNVELKSGELTSGKPVDVKFGLDLESGAPAIRTRVDLKSRVAVDLDKQTLAVSGLVLEAAGLKLKADAKGARILSTPEFSGDLEVASFSPRAFLEKLGIKIETADKTALGHAALTTKFDASTKSLRLKDASAGLDDSKLKGSFEIVNFSQPSYKFDLTLDNFDLDRYMPPAAPAKKPADKGANKSQKTTAVIPLDVIRKLNAAGRFRIGKFKVFGVRSSDVLISIAAKDGLVKLDPTEAKLYSGAYKGAASYDARGSNPALNIEEQLSGVQLGPLLKDAQVFDKFTGIGNINAKLKGSGYEVGAITASLNGTADVLIKDGTFIGVDLKKTADQIKLIKKEGLKESLKNIAPQKGDQTKFSQLHASAQIKNGVAYNEDLAVQVPGVVAVTGKGNADLTKSVVDYVVYVEDVPVKAQGPFSDIKFRLDTDAILKAEGQKRLKQEGEKLKEKAKDIFKNFKIK
jgi:AsmA protein